jgi:hypothetical protein
MKTFVRGVMCLVMFGLVGCTFSVHPLLEKEHLSREFDLAGTWERQEFTPPTKEKQRKVRVLLEGFDGGSSYDLREIGADESVSGDEWLIQVGQCAGRDYLQFTRDDLPPPQSLPVLVGIPVYSFARFELAGDELRTYRINDNWVEHKLDRNSTPQIRRGEKGLGRPWIILTIPPDQLRALVEKHGDEMFVKTPDVWRRVAKVPPKKDAATE